MVKEGGSPQKVSRLGESEEKVLGLSRTLFFINIFRIITWST